MASVILLVDNFVSTKASIGKNTQIWHYTYVGDNTEIGDNVTIGSLAHVDYNVKIGNNTRIEGHAYIPPLSRIGNNVFIGPAAVLTNDPYPICDRLVGITIMDNAIIGGGVVIKAGVTVGRNSIVAMGAVVTRDVPDDVFVMGVPATVRYTRQEYEQRKKRWLQS